MTPGFRAVPAVLLIVLCLVLSSHATKSNDSEIIELALRENGPKVYMTQKLFIKLKEESETWHWTPWLATRTRLQGDVLYEVECLDESSLDSFPDSIFNDDQLRSGGFLLYVLFGCYSFILLAFVCNDYFVPSVEIICERFKIPQNVAAATFMAVATSCPEFFVNVFSTFLTGSDMGIGTIVGSGIFNCLGVAAIGGLAARSPIKIEWRPMTRDALTYLLNVSVLVLIVWDGRVTWYEAMVLGILYVCYFIFMFNSTRLFTFYDKLNFSCCKKNTLDVSTPSTMADDNKWFDKEIIEKPQMSNELHKGIAAADDKDFKEIEEPIESIWSFPKDSSIFRKMWWLSTWPLRFALAMTIPSPATCSHFYPLSFIMCIIWIGVNSYFVTWTMTVIGHTLFIPESVMGMTFLAFGGCLPEACSIFIMSRKGEGGMGVSNALGANSLAILFALGMPWLIKTLVLVGQGSPDPVVHINSAGIDFIVGSLFVAVVCLWITLYIGKFTLRKTLGGVLVCLYLIFVTFAILVELGILVDKGISLC